MFWQFVAFHRRLPRAHDPLTCVAQGVLIQNPWAQACE
ncbi:hypothetical protein FRUB_02007 [Fimbriiglobus ruber]|uniref:Uncharacterized protein n=1 Tax=Fimbriiglobus ruber TaxID=1908690 RepID=A0A225E6E5_9BACT|nr:hypothetical protein FRUB_02007 [Fimbriiglobus ruber]